MDILSSLNSKQREAVETIYGPVLVIAWPGSGKTQLLSARVAYILEKTDYAGENILCLTFTDNAARNMRERLAKMIGHDAYRVNIMTFHSFGNEIVQRYRAFSEGFAEAEPLDDITAHQIIDSMLDGLPWDHPFKPGFRAQMMVRDIFSDIGDLKKSGLTPDKFRTILTNNQQTIEAVTPILQKYWSQIDALGQKKAEKEQKIVLFEAFIAEVGVHTSETTSLYGYNSLAQVMLESAQEALIDTQSSGKTTAMNDWRDAWTEKDTQGARRLKESTKIEKQLALADIYEHYQKELQERGLIDFSDMILEAIRLLETHEVIRMNLAEKYQIIMIDEFQDTNEAQMQLIDHIASVETDAPNIFAVGDDDQSIYKFQGANTKNIRDFRDRYHGTKLIILEKNYRSHQEIIDTSRGLLTTGANIGQIFPGAEKQFLAEKWTGGNIVRARFASELEEITFLAEDIAGKIASWIPPQDIAVITKKNASLELVAKTLLQKNIPVSVSKEESLFELDEMRLLVNILKLLGNLDGAYRDEDNELLFEVLSHPAFDINRLTLWQLAKTVKDARKEINKSVIEQLRRHTDPMLQNIGHFLMELSQRARIERLEDIIDYITGANTMLYEDEYGDDQSWNILQISLIDNEKKNFISPYNQYFFGNTYRSSTLYARHLAHLKKFIDTIRGYKHQKPFLGLSDALDILALIEKYSIRLGVSTLLGDEKHSVQCITVHKAKWLEWKQVYVPFLTQKEYEKWGKNGSSFPKNLPLQAEKDSTEDTERLVYTAATRAENSLTLSFSDTSINEKSLSPVSSIADIAEEFEAQNIDTPEGLVATLEVDQDALVTLPYIGEEENFLKASVEKFVMNVTALQNFLDLEHGGPQSFIKRTLLKFPQAKSINASYGSAIHDALEQYMLHYGQHGVFDDEMVFEVFEKRLAKEGFNTKTFTEYLERGRDNLTLLLPEIHSTTSSARMELEYSFRQHGGVFLPREDGLALQLDGKIDKIEILPDDSLIITDYKTGRGFETLSGSTVKHWKYELQLRFYAVLFELSPRFRMFPQAQTRYELFFVEQDKKEKQFFRVQQYIQESEKERTKNLIRAVMKKIEHLDFPDVSKYSPDYKGIREFEEDLLNGRI